MQTIRPWLANSLATLAIAVCLTACGGGASTQGPGTSQDTDEDGVPDAHAESTGKDADADATPETENVDVQVPSACLTAQVCAADTDCNQGERCNLTLVPPECQTLYCAKEDEACDPSQGDALCVSGLVCTESEPPACCAPDCDSKQCGSDGCGGTCGVCPGAQEECRDGSCECVADCTARECGDDGCGASCGVCSGALEACVDGVCVCQPTCTDRECGDDGCGGNCGECDDGLPCTRDACDQFACTHVVIEHVWCDPGSGLMWQAEAPSVPMGCTAGDPPGSSCTFVEADSYCKTLFLAAFDDWRVPTIAELRGLIRGCPATVTDGVCPVTESCASWSCWTDVCMGCDKLAGPGSEGCYWPADVMGSCKGYWASTPISSTLSWGVGFDGANIGNIENKNGAHVRCVRGGE